MDKNEEIIEQTRHNVQESRIQDFKSEKRTAKSQMTSLLKRLGGVLVEENARHDEIKELLERSSKIKITRFQSCIVWKPLIEKTCTEKELPRRKLTTKLTGL